MLLVISSARAILRRYGSINGEQLLVHISQLEQALAAIPGEVIVVFPDDETTMRRYGLGPMDLSSSAAVRGALQLLYNTSKLAAIEALLLVGGDAIIPFHRVSNPIPDNGIDPDSEILTDNGYGFHPGDTSPVFDPALLPSLPVARLPDFDPPSAEGFLSLIDGLAQPVPARAGSFAVVDADWAEQTASALAGTSATLRTAPPWTAADPEWQTQGAKLLYFNLHGFADRFEWRAFNHDSGNWRDCLRPVDVTGEAVTGAVVLAENCYGALVVNRSPRNSIALAMLAAGAGAFIGSTGLAYGSLMTSGSWLGDADLLAAKMLGKMATASSVGSAFSQGRAEAFSGSALRDVYQRKTALEFVLLGNPLATL